MAVRYSVKLPMSVNKPVTLSKAEATITPFATLGKIQVSLRA